MRVLRTVILGATLLLAAPSYAGDDDAEAIRTRLRAAIPTSALPVTGTVGEIPAGALEIGILADGTYLCDGKECGHDELEAALRRHADAGKRSEIGESELALVLRVDRETPWPLVHWCLLICGAPNVGIYRTYFAIVPEAGGPEGVLDCFLPASGSLRMPSKVPALEVRVAADTETADRGAVFAAMKAVLDASEASTWDLMVSSPSPLVLRTGHMLTLMDLGWRAGARAVWFGGARAGRRRGGEADIPGIRGSVEWFRAYASILRRDVPAGLKVRIAGLPLTGGPHTKVVPLPSPPPRGRLAVRPPYEGPPWPEDIEEDAWASGSQPLPTAPPKDPDAPRPPADADPAVRSQHAIDLALAWLATHQSRNGNWGAEGFPYWCDGKLLETSTLDGKGKGQHDVGVTGLAVLAFLGAGVSGISDTPHGKILARGLRYLRSIQDEEGCVGPRLSGHFVYGHAIAAIALVEAYRAAPAPGALATAQKALDFIALARNPKGAWRYGVQPGDDDTSVTGWMFLALDRARRVNAAAPRERPAPFTIDAASLDASRAWIEAMTDPATGRLGYVVRGSGSARQAKLVDTFPAEKVETLTAIGVFVRTGLGEDPLSIPSIVQGTNLIATLPPVWDPQDGSIDMYYWHFGAIAMAQVGGETARAWQLDLVAALAGHQRTDGDACGARGSWDPIDPWGGEGGRVYATAMSVLALQATVTHARKTGAGR